MFLRLTSRWPTSASIMATIAATAVIGIPMTVYGEDVQAAGPGDATRGQKLSYTCYGCHGVENYKNVYPTYSVPKLQGQHPEYLAIALQEYKEGNRAHSTMHAQASSQSAQDMKDIAVFLAGSAVKAIPSAGAKPALPKAAEACTACHGKDGVGLTPQYPTLTGQHRDYIARALHDYKSGARKNPIMATFAAQLKDKDIEEIAEYYSKQRPGLSTAEHAVWFSAKKKTP